MSRKFTFREAVNGAIAQEVARKDVKDIADSHGGETSASGDSGGMNEVTRDNRKSRFRFTKRDKGHTKRRKIRSVRWRQEAVLLLWSHKSHTR